MPTASTDDKGRNNSSCITSRGGAQMEDGIALQPGLLQRFHGPQPLSRFMRRFRISIPDLVWVNI